MKNWRKFIIYITVIYIIPIIILFFILDAYAVNQNRKVISRSDVMSLASIINAECSKCNNTELYLIGSVVINRSRNSLWPNTIDSVINEPNQFHGRLTKNYHITALSTHIATELLEGLYVTPDIYYFCLKNTSNRPMDSIVIEADYHYFGK